MKQRTAMLTVLLTAAAFQFAFSAGADAQTADEVRKATGVGAGLAVVLGSSDGRLEAGLADDGKILVQGLTTDAGACRRAREHLFAEGVYGQAAVDCVADLRTLPFYDRLVNLMVADLDALGDAGPSMDEITRVLGYKGVAYVKRGGAWRVHVRPMPEEAAEFTHYHYDATRSNLSPDRLVGPPNALRWVGKPSDHNGYLGARVAHGITFLRSGTGKGNKSCEEVRDLPMIVVAKDAFSGVTLWSRRQTLKAGLSRRLEWGVVGKNRLFLYTRGTPAEGWLDDGAGEVAIEAWNIHTGETELRFPIGNFRDDGDKPFLKKYLKDDAIMAVADGRFLYNLGPRLIVRDEASGKVRWTKDLSDEGGWISRFLVADGVVVALVAEDDADRERAYRIALNAPFQSLVAWSLDTGREVWRYDGARLWEGTDFAKGGGKVHCFELTGYSDGRLPVVLWNERPRRRKSDETFPHAVVALLDVASGKRLWATASANVPGGFNKLMADHYIVGGRVYLAQLTAVATAFDLATGREVPTAATSYTPRTSNCCAGTATSRYLVLQRNYIPWNAIQAIEHTAAEDNPAFYYTRLFSLACKGKITPAYGTTYNPEGSCNCIPFLSGSVALCAAAEVEAVPDDTRRTTDYPGTIASPVNRQKKALDSAVAFDWKLRPGREGMTWGGPKKHPKNRATGSCQIWGYGKHETEPLTIGDLTVIGYVNEHRVTATRAGQTVWTFVAGGRIGYRGPLQTDGKRVYFASHDGCIYAVNLSDGRLAWRVLAAPADRRMVAFGQVESSWPLFNVVLHDGRVYGCAGRHHELDGGLHLWAVDAETGEVLWHARRRFGLADREHEGAIRGANQVRSPDWPKDGRGVTTPALWAVNGPVAVQDGKLVVLPNSHTPLAVPLDGAEDAVVNVHTLVPPEVNR
ncbi:MAG: PQQ-binding-like beta-propeller repeat protein [Phycisphaerae bacterium]